MNDIFGYLIIIFVIVSFLRSLFKSASKNAPQGKTSNYPRRDDSTISEKYDIPAKTSSSNENYDILRELENILKLPKIEPQNQSSESKTYAPSPFNRDKKDYTNSQREHQLTDSEHSLSSVNKVTSVIEEESIRFEQILLQKSKRRNETAIALRKKLRNTKDIKDAIILSEILYKPKYMD